MAIGYKRLKRTGNNLWYSCVQHAEKGGRTYRVGVSTTPRPAHGPLCVFRTRRQAKLFDCGSHIARCRYRKSYRKGIWFLLWGKGAKREPWWELPAGTVFAESVTLLEEPRDADTP